MAAAAAGDTAGAGTIFTDRVHDRLHELADRLDAVDRDAAGRRLWAKQAVEANLAGPAAPQFRTHLSDLHDAVTDATVAAGEPRPEECEP